MKKIGAVIPAWNEEQDISLVLNTVGPVKWLSEIVVIDDGSIDNTLAVAQECAGQYPHMVVEQLAENKGKGAAMLAGVRALNADIEVVIFLDADLYGFSADHLAKLSDPVVSQRCDMTVAGFRKGRWRTDLSQRFTPNLSGQRCLPPCPTPRVNQSRVTESTISTISRPPSHTGRRPISPISCSTACSPSPSFGPQ